MILSFSYEIPLVYITSMYKANPYLFDVSSSLLIFYWVVRGRFRGWTLSLKNPIVPPWLMIVAAFTWATVVSAVWLPIEMFQFSVWYLGTYYQGLLVLLIFLAAPLTEKDKRGLMWVALVGGSWCATVAILQVFEIVGTARVIPKGWEVGLEGNGIISTLGPTYFHAGIFSVVTTLIGIALYGASRGTARWVAALLAGLCAIPATVAGSRAAFLALVISVGVVVVNNRQYRQSLGMWFFGFLFVVNINMFYAGSLTQYRTSQKFGEEQYQLEARGRIEQTFPQIWDEMKEHPVMTIAGGGFYVVPRGDRWRIGYGIHNLFLLPFEQAGIAALLGSLWLWWRLGTRLGRRRPGPNESSIDLHVRGALFGYFIALMVVGWAGGHFWMKGGTEHLNSYLILMLGLALTETGGARSPSPISTAAENYSGVVVPFLER
ncbi:MAG: hypothetical protein VCE43_18525 [Myxococcota bacterium]